MKLSKENMICKWSPLIQNIGIDKYKDREYFNLLCEYAEESYNYGINREQIIRKIKLKKIKNGI